MRHPRAIALVRWLLTFAVVAVIAAGGAFAVYRYLRPQVTVTTVVEGPVVSAFYATGTLLPEREYPIKSNAAGFVTEVLVDKGDRVRKGQQLALVVEDAVHFRFDQAKADVEQKRKLAEEKSSPVIAEFDARISAWTELLGIAQREEKRLRGLVEGGIGSRTEWDRAMDRVKTVWSELEAQRAQRKAKLIELAKDLEIAEAALKIAQWNLDRQTVKCPIEEGVVLDRPTTVGTRVAVNDHLMLVADVRPEKLVMRAAVDEEDVVSAHVGQTVRMVLYSFPGRPFEGKVKRIYDKAEPERRTFEVDIEMTDKDPRLAAGMTAELAFVIEEKARATVIPAQAVQGGRVYVVRDGTVREAQVELGLRSVERIEVLKGLAPQDRIVISPAAGLSAGQRVRTDFLDPVTAANLNKPKVEKTFTKFN